MRVWRESAMLRELMEAEAKGLRSLWEEDNDDARSIRPGTPEPGMRRETEEDYHSPIRQHTVGDS
jgi:hypothetical protein